MLPGTVGLWGMGEGRNWGTEREGIVSAIHSAAVPELSWNIIYVNLSTSMQFGFVFPEF